MKKKVVLNCVPPTESFLPSPALSILKSWLAINNINSSVIYWNLHFLYLQNDFVWNNSNILGESNSYALYTNYIICQSGNQKLYDSFKKLLQGIFPRYLDRPGYYDEHMQSFVSKTDKLIEDILSDIDMSEILFFGFSIKMDGWLVSSIIAEKIKKIAPDIPIVVGGINTKKQAKAFLECFPVFDVAIWGEGEGPILQLAEEIDSGRRDYDNVSHALYRVNETIFHSQKPNNYFMNLSQSDVYPDYSDYFIQKKELLINQETAIPIEGSRGCHWNKCKFCYLNTGYKYRLKSIDKICSEIKYMIKEYNISSFEFLDNDFIGSDIIRFNEVLDALIALKKDVPGFKIIAAEIITKGLDHATIKKMYEAGVEYVQIGYESTSSKLLKKIRKKNTFASNLLYVKIANLYKVFLKSVNVIVNMPDETTDDIVEAIDNLLFLRFFLSPANFKHHTLPLNVNSASRYFPIVKEEAQLWNLYTIAYEFIKYCIPEKYYWDIFTYIKPTQNFHWSTFKGVEQHYLSNKYSYSISALKDEGPLTYTEYINGNISYSFSFEKDSLEAYVLFFTNNRVISLIDLYEEINIVVNNRYTFDEVVKTVDFFYSKGLVYHSFDYEEMISVIFIEESKISLPFNN